ncbi:unnamed protein product [Natator depressus]
MEIVTNMTQDRENLYSVVSHVTVTEGEDNGDISCIVRNGLLQTERQSAIHLSGDIFPQVSPWLAAFWVLFTLVLIAAGACAYLGYTAKRKASQKKPSKEEALLNLDIEKKTLDAESQALREKLEVQSKAYESECQELHEMLASHSICVSNSFLFPILASKEKKNKELESECQELREKLECQELSKKIETNEKSLKSVKRKESKKKPSKDKAVFIHEIEKKTLDADTWLNPNKSPEGQELHEKLEWRKARNKIENITLDARTAHPNLSISDDKKSLKHEAQPQKVPPNPERFDLTVCVLGCEGFSSGEHSWAVDVGSSTDWDLGVAKKSIQRKEKFSLSPKEGFWALGLSGRDYWAKTDPWTPVIVQKKAEKIGVYISYEEGRVTFFNETDKSVLFTFKNCSFSGAVYPFFKSSDKETSMKICSVKEEE